MSIFSHEYFEDDNNGEGFPLELGATWIHGIQGNPVFKLAKQHKLLTPSPKRATRKKGSQRHKVRILTCGLIVMV